KSWTENLTIGVFFDEINVYEKSFKSLDKLEKAITNYIFDYNNKRIKTKLKGLSPVQYRTESFQ
ncbi:IS3 family transposase, partial [Streptococcus mutans]|uniref:IS3 family transposase n=2 Tax=Streptococcus mutans TaxID=1309 RepID=UPI0002B57444